MHIKTVVCILLSALILSVKSQCTRSPTVAKGSRAPSKKSFCSGELVFEDNFDNLDLHKWKHESTLGGGGNWEFQWYSNSPKNSYIDRGILKIKPSLTSNDLGGKALSSQTLDLNRRPEGCTNSNWYGCVRTGSPQNILNPIKSARLSTIDSFSFRYGRVKVRAKLPKGDWLWPAIWMLPKGDSYGEWPASGEIDIMESRGNENLNQNGVNIGVKQTSSTLHWGPTSEHNRFSQTHVETTSTNGFHEKFHNYEVSWGPDSIIFSIDGGHTLTVTPPSGGFWEKGRLGNTGKRNPWSGSSKMAPFDREFYIILNLAVGGTNQYFPDNASNPGRKPWSNSSPKAATDFWNGKSSWLPTWNMGSDTSALQIDYVRVYAF